MAVEKSTAINASDLDGYLTTSDASKFLTTTDAEKYLTAETVMSALDIDALKEAMGVANTSAAKIVGAVTAKGNSNNKTTVILPTSDYDYLEIIVWDNIGVPIGTSNASYHITQANIEPRSTFVSKGVSQFDVSFKTITSNGVYTYIIVTNTTTCQLSDSTLTLPTGYLSYNIIQYKNP